MSLYKKLMSNVVGVGVPDDPLKNNIRQNNELIIKKG